MTPSERALVMIADPVANPGAIKELEGLGLNVDQGFPPLLVDAVASRYVIRGWVDAEGIRRLRKHGFEVFPDVAIGPAEGSTES